MVSTPCARLPHMPLEEQRWRIWHAPPRSRGRSAHGVFSYEERGIPATMQGSGDQWEEEVGKECQRWVVTRDAAGRCEHDSGNIAVFERTLLSMLHSQGDRTLLTGLALGVIAYMDPPGIVRAISCDSSQALRLHAYIRPVSWRTRWPPGLDGFRALPPPHLNDLLAVCAISRVWKSRSDLLCHAYVTTHAIIW